MTPAESMAELRNRIEAPLERLTAREGLSAMLDFYTGQRAICAPLDEDGDMLLFQWGIHGAPTPSFRIDFTRQFIVPDEDEPYQLSLTFHFLPTAVLKAMNSGSRWCHSLQDIVDFRDFVKTSAAFNAVADNEPMSVELDFEQC